MTNGGDLEESAAPGQGGPVPRRVPFTRTRRHAARLAAAAGLILLALYFFVTYSVVPRVVFEPDPDISRTPANAGLDYSPLILATSDSLRLRAWYVPAAAGAAVVLYCHGNAGNRGSRIGVLRALHELGLAVLIFDYRGYGGNGGNPSESGTYTDSEAAWSYLVDRLGVDPRQVVIYGESLGGAVAARLASRHAAGGLILDSTFTTLRDVASSYAPMFVARLFLRYHFDTLAAVKGVRSPVLVLNSPEDRIVPFTLGRALYDAAPDPKRFVRLRGPHTLGFRYSPVVYAGGVKWLLQAAGLAPG